MAKQPPSPLRKAGKFVQRIFKGRGDRWFYRRDDGRVVFASAVQKKKGVALEKRRRQARVRKEILAQKKRRKRRRLQFLLQFTGAELREVLKQERQAKKLAAQIEKQEANQIISNILRAANPTADWFGPEISYRKGTAFYSRTWRAVDPVYYTDLLAVLDRMRTHPRLSDLMAEEGETWLNVEVTDPEYGSVGDDGGHALSAAYSWDLAVEQAISNPHKGAEALAAKYIDSLISAFIIYQYK